MNKIMKSTLLLSVLTSLSMAEGMYFGGGATLEDIEDVDDNGIAVELTVGKVFYNNFGVEGKLTKTVSSSETKDNGIKGKFKVMTLSVFGTYSHVLTPELTIMPKVGFTQFSTDLALSDNFGGSRSLDDKNSDISFGIDLKYKMNIDTNLYVGYTTYSAEINDHDFDANHFSVGIQKRF